MDNRALFYFSKQPCYIISYINIYSSRLNRNKIFLVIALFWGC